MTNTEIANRLQEHARQLRKRHNNLYRVKAYRFAAQAVQRLDRPIETIVAENGPHALEELPGIGKRLATTIARFVQTGEWQTRN